MKIKKNNDINVIGAGLAGCECAYQLSRLGYKVNLYEMKPKKLTPAHSMNTFAELVCSNSLKSDDRLSASGLLKAEMRELNSLILKVAEKYRVPAGSALAVDREKFSLTITEQIKNDKNITVINEEITELPTCGITVVATGPLTTDELSKNIAKLLGSEALFFFDASAPIVSGNTIDKNSSFEGSRYDKGDADYLNCPMNTDEYNLFYNELINAETIKLKSFENLNVFEGCMPVEVLAKRGRDSLRFGPLKPVGLLDSKTGKRPYAVLQLRKENVAGDLFNLVGFQTNLKFGEQKRVFSLIPALRNAEFVKYGVMHRNTYINSPKSLNTDFSAKNNKNIFFAGQLTGVEGYMESTMSGIITAINVHFRITGKKAPEFSAKTMIGAIIKYIFSCTDKNFSPMNANYGIIEPITEIIIKDKNIKKNMIYDNSIQEIKTIKEKYKL